MPEPDPGPVLDPVPARRVVAAPAALDALVRDLAAADPGCLCLRLAPDELLVLGDSATAPPLDDPHAIDVADAGWSAARLDPVVVLDVLSWATTWPVGPDRPVLLQGMAAGVPVKVWLPVAGEAVVLVATPLAHDLQERWR